MPTFSIPEMSCGHCKATVEKTVHALDPKAVLEFDMGARRVAVQSTHDVEAIKSALSAAGYPAMVA